MNREQRMVLAFHKAAGHLCNQRPTHPSDIPASETRLRLALIREEFAELCLAIDNDDMPEIADGFADLLYVVYGAALLYGLNMEPLFAEVHRSNMTKITDAPKYRPDGKLMKPPGWEPPRMQAFLTMLSERSLD